MKTTTELINTSASAHYIELAERPVKIAITETVVDASGLLINIDRDSGGRALGVEIINWE